MQNLRLLNNVEFIHKYNAILNNILVFRIKRYCICSTILLRIYVEMRTNDSLTVWI